MIDVLYPPVGVEEPPLPRIEEDVVELPLLLPVWQVAKLETIAYQHGMTAAEMVRHLLRDFLTAVPAQRHAPAT